MLVVHRLFAWRFGQPVSQVLAIDLFMLSVEMLLATFLLQRPSTSTSTSTSTRR